MAQKVTNFGSFTHPRESLLRVKDFSSYVGIFESDETISFFIGDSFAKVYYDKVLPFAKQGNSIFLGEEGNQEENRAGLYFPSSGDLTLKKFKNLISNYSTEQPKATYVFLFTSTVDSIENFEKNNQNVRNAREIREGLAKIFPNVANFFVPVLGDSSDKTRKEYYLGVWQNNGFNVIMEKEEVDLIEKIASAINGLYSKEKLDSEKEEKDKDVSIEVNPGTTDEFYKYLEDAIKNNTILYAQSDGVNDPVYTYNPTVERAQIGLKALNRGYDLPKYGADGLFGPETKDAVQSFKRDFKVGGDSVAMDTPFFSALLSNLKSINFTNQELQSTVQVSKEMTKNYFDLSGIGGNDEYLIYMLHQQGPAGAPALVEAMYGVGKLHPQQRNKNLTANVVGSYKGMKSRIRTALDSGNEQEAASLFLNMWKETYANKKKRALTEINSAKNASVKGILQKYSKQEGIPYDYLVTKAYIESGFNPNSGNRTYKGLFALDPNSGYAKNSGLTHSNVHDPEANTKSAIYLMKSQIGPFVNRLNGKGLLAAGKVDLGEMRNLA
jgi:peptidoglycan hydrolase-like protein with peptidoglycan-binding domain